MSISWVKGLNRNVIFVHLTTIIYLSPLFPPPQGATALSKPVPPHCRGFAITLRHTTVDRTPLKSDQSDAETVQNTHNRHTCTRQDSNP